MCVRRLLGGGSRPAISGWRLPLMVAIVGRPLMSL